ncbi:MAG: branched-chain amino acid aminotransferase [bacterium]|nr:branched-chain amino acid aminotransferase [bacterium]
MNTYYVDGQFVNDEDSVIAARDLTVLRGFGIFDFLITYNKRPFYLKEHVQRLENSAKYIGLSLNHSNEEICEIVEECIKKNSHHDESNVRIVYTGGVSSDGITPEGNGKLMIMVTPRYILPEWWYTDGAKVITNKMERFIPGAKSTNYLNAVFALKMAKEKEAIESIYVDPRNRVLEGTTTNFFFFKENKLITSNADILPGITRSVILKLVDGLFDVEERDIDFSELESMEEVFITASNKEVVPIVKIDELTIGNGKPGERSLKVMELFRDYTEKFGKGLI